MRASEAYLYSNFARRRVHFFNMSSQWTGHVSDEGDTGEGGDLSRAVSPLVTALFSSFYAVSKSNWMQSSLIPQWSVVWGRCEDVVQPIINLISARVYPDLLCVLMT